MTEYFKHFEGNMSCFYTEEPVGKAFRGRSYLISFGIFEDVSLVQFSPVKRPGMVFTNSIQTKNGGVTVGFGCVDVCVQILRRGG